MNADIRSTTRLFRASRLRKRAKAGLILLSCLLLSNSAIGLSATPAGAEQLIVNPTVVLLSDGTAPFTATDGPGLDSGAHNGVLRVQDTAVWEVSYTGAAEGSALFEATLPEGMQWAVASVSAAVCDGSNGGTVSSNQRVLRCDRIIHRDETTAFPVSAVAGALPNGASVEPHFSVNGQEILSSAPVTISASPKIALALRNGPQQAGSEFAGERGVTTPLKFFLGAELDPNNPRYLGYEALKSPIEFELDVPDGTVVSTQNSASVTTSQVHAGDPVHVTLNANGSTLDFMRPEPNGFSGGLAASGLAADARVIASYDLSLFTSYEGNIAVGQTVILRGQVRGFDPVSLSGQENFAGAFAPGHEPGANCPAIPASDMNASCFGKAFTRSAAPVLKAGYSTTSNSEGAGDIYADDHPYTSGNEAVLVGQQYNVQTNVFNAASAEEPLGGAYASLSWNPDQQHLTELPRGLVQTGVTGFVGYSAIQASQPVSSGGVEFEYSDYRFSGDAERRSLESFSSTLPRWVSDPQQLTGGLASVSSVRVRIHEQILPNSTVGFVFPMQRSDESKSLAAGSNLPWFWQYGSATSPLVKSNYSGAGATSSGLGGNVQAAEALLRANISFLPVRGASYPAGQAERGDLVELNVTPVVIGPLSGGDSLLRDAKLRVTMPSACIKPLTSALPAGAVVTPESGESDCNLATASTVTIPLGTLTAPAGPAADGAYPGRATALEPIVFPVVVGAGLSVPTQFKARVTELSPSDPTAENHANNPFSSSISRNQDRTQTAALQVSAASTVKASAASTTQRPGEIGPAETATEMIVWTNTSSVAYTEASFVSVLPFDGDGRGTTGLGASKIQVFGIGALDLDNGAETVKVEYSTEDPSTVMAALDRTGNAGGTTGIDWKVLEGVLPSSVSALRFLPEAPLLPGTAGGVSISYQAPTIEYAGALGSDVSFRVSGGSDQLSLRHGSASLLESSSALLAGHAYLADAQGSPDSPWGPAADGIEIVDQDGQVLQADVAADGSFQFDSLQPGKYSIQLSAGASSGWHSLAPSVVDLGLAEAVTDARLVVERAPLGEGASNGRSEKNAEVSVDPPAIGGGQQASETPFSEVAKSPPAVNALTVTIDSDADSITFDPIGQSSGVNLRALENSTLAVGFGKVELKGDRVVYRPAKAFRGVDSIRIDVVDDLGQRLALNYTINVLAPGQGPPLVRVGGEDGAEGHAQLPNSQRGDLFLAETGGDLSRTLTLMVSLTGFGTLMILLRRKTPKSF